VSPGDEIGYKFTGKELDEETGLYYYGARYLDPKTSRWLSADPAMGDYIPEAPADEETRRRNGNLPGMGGIYNYVNLHAYHYAGNNPVRYTDPDGRITKADHFARNENQNGYAPANQERMNKLVDMKLFTNWGNTGTHNLNPNEDNPQGRWAAFVGGNKGTNTDYRGAVGTIFEGMQFVYDSAGNLVLDSVNKGTFDTKSPNSDPLGHFLNDVNPWLDWGNGPPDNYQDVVMTEENWNKIENIYTRFSNGEITQDQAAKEVQQAFRTNATTSND
jgi:hypothetical protein